MNNNGTPNNVATVTPAAWIVTRYSGGMLVTETYTNWNAVGSLIALGRAVSVVAA